MCVCKCDLYLEAYCVVSKSGKVLYAFNAAGVCAFHQQ